MVGKKLKEKPKVMPKEIEEKKEYSEGLAAVRGSLNRWGFVDEDNNIVIEPQYGGVTPFYHGVSVVIYGQHWKVIDKTGNELSGSRRGDRCSDEYEILYDGIGEFVHQCTGHDRDPDREYYEGRFVFDTGESVRLYDLTRSFGYSEDWRSGYIPIPKKSDD